MRRWYAPLSLCSCHMPCISHDSSASLHVSTILLLAGVQEWVERACDGSDHHGALHLRYTFHFAAAFPSTACVQYSLSCRGAGVGREGSRACGSGGHLQSQWLACLCAYHRPLRLHWHCRLQPCRSAYTQPPIQPFIHALNRSFVHSFIFYLVCLSVCCNLC